MLNCICFFVCICVCINILIYMFLSLYYICIAFEIVDHPIRVKGTVAQCLQLLSHVVTLEAAGACSVLIYILYLCLYFYVDLHLYLCVFVFDLYIV